MKKITFLIACFTLTIVHIEASAQRRGTKTEAERRDSRKDEGQRNQEKVTETAQSLEKQRGLELGREEAVALAEAAQTFKSFNSLVETLLAPSQQEPATITLVAKEGARIAKNMRDVDPGNLSALKDLFAVTNSMSLTARGEIKGTEAQTVLNIAREVAANLENGLKPNEAVAQAATLKDEAKRKEFIENCR